MDSSSPLIPTYLPTKQQPIIAMSRISEFHEYEMAKRQVLQDFLSKDSFRKMHVEAWKGVGATALLREVAKEVKDNKSKEFKFDFDRVIKVVGPAPFKNRREIQRVVAKQLNLPTNILDAIDDEDDFDNAEFSPRDMLSEVTDKIHQAVKDHKVLLVFCNNVVNGKLIDPIDDLGIPTGGRWDRNKLLWTTGMNISSEALSASADLRLRIEPLNKAEALYLVYKEAAEIARYIKESSRGSLWITPQLVLRCFWYCLLLCGAFNRSELLLLDDDRPSKAVANYFVCEGILKGDAAWEIGRALAPLIGPIIKYQLQYWGKTFSTWTPWESELLLKYNWKKNFSTWTLSVSELLPPKTLFIDSITQEDRVKSSSSEKKESNCWISVRSPQNNNPDPWDFFKIYGNSDMSKVSSFFVHFEITHQVALPDSFFYYFSNIRVLDLLGCIVNPINSSFLRLRNLRMLRLEQCSVIDPSSLSSAQEEKREQQAIFFDSLWVLNLYNSDADTFLLAGKAFDLMPNLRELDLTEHINTEFLPRSLSMAINLKELILTDCEGLQYLNFNLPATIETISLRSCASLEKVELVDPTAAPLPNLKTFHLSNSQLIAKLSLQGCRKLENVDLQELTGLKELNLSCTAIKVVDITKLPQLKQLFLLGCQQLCRVVCPKKEERPGLFRYNFPDSSKIKENEGPRLDVLYLDNYNNNSACDVDHCLDSFQNQSLPDLTKETNDADQRLFRAHVVVRDGRILRTIYYAFRNLSEGKTFFHIHIKGSSTTKRGINIGTTTKSNATITTPLCYANVLNTMTDHHPAPPTMPLNNHIEVDGGDDSRILDVEKFTYIMKFANSLFVHDNTSKLFIRVEVKDLKYLHIEKCHNMEFIFYSRGGGLPYSLVKLESIWLSQLPRLKALRYEGRIKTLQLKHIYLEFCARLDYVLTSLSELDNLETINIRYCNDLTAIFKPDKDERGAAPMLLPKLRSIHLQELPKLQHIYELNINIRAPPLEELKIRGCFNLRKLPLFGTSDARSIKAVKISCEKDWWDKLQWDGLKSNHHASLFNPKHCRYYKKPMKARWL